MEENSYFKWDDKLSLNIHRMDDEHKYLIQLMNELHKLHSTVSSHPIIESKISELLKYTEKHFNNEEILFTSLPYEKINIHKNIHKELIAKLKEHAAKINENKKIHDDFFMFLKVWLSAHIMGIDQGYAQVHKNKSA